jgi:amidase
VVYQPAAKLAAMIRRKEVSSEELVRACLERIEAVNPKVNAVVTLVADRALDEAKKADAALANGVSRGPLHGVPMTIKDSFDTAGVRSTAGTKGREHYVPTEDATAVARLRAAGAVLMGKTNTSELTMSFITDNLLFGPTRNPYSQETSSGGSSGGAAAIVATGGSPLDIGTDTGGSVRVPAGFCGIAGLKPTRGRVPRTGHVISYGLGAVDPLTHVGPLARFVDDLALMLPILAGPDWRDPAAVPMPLGRPGPVKLDKLRVAFYTDNGVFSPPDEVAETVKSAAARLAETGATVEEKCPVAGERTVEVAVGLWLCDDARCVARLVKQVGTAEWSPALDWHDDPEMIAKAKADFGVKDCADAARRYAQFKSDMMPFLRDYDVILCPVNGLSVLPFDIEEYPTLNLAGSYTTAFNLTGWPAAVVRAGTAKCGVPIGVQIVARPSREDVALAVAKYLENEFGGWQPPRM